MGRISRARSFAVLLDVAVVTFVGQVALVLSTRLTLANIAYDENFFVWSGWSLLKGQTPYRDFSGFKPPISYLLNALGIALLGVDGLRFRYLLQWLMVGSVLLLLVALIKRGVDRFIAGCLALLVAGLFFEQLFHDSSLNDTESIGLAFYLYGLALLLWPPGRRRITEGLGCACLAAAVLAKEPFALVVGPTWLAFLFDERRTLDRPGILGYVKRSFAGVFAVVALVGVHLVATGGLSHYFAMLKFYGPFAKKYCTTIGRFTPGPFLAEEKQNWDHILGEFLQFGRFAAWVPFFVAALTTPSRRRLMHLGLVVVAVFGALYSATLGHCYWIHYYVVCFAGAALLGAVGAIGLQQRLDRWKKGGLKGWARALLLVPVYFALSPRYDAEKVAVYHASKYGGLNADVIDFIRANTAKGDVVFTTGAPGIYVMADRLGPRVGPNAFLDEILIAYPGENDDERLASLRAELERAMPRLIYLDPDHEDRRARFMGGAITPFMKEHGYEEVRPRFWMLPGK
jgi:hypothetical protein